jgi:hypothetical protein
MTTIDLNPRVQGTVERLENADWFSACGLPVNSDVIVLSSWEEASRSCAGDQWQELLLEHSNQLSESVARISRERFRGWNAFVEGVRPLVMMMVSQKTQRGTQGIELPKIVYDTVSWDILHILLEAEYADLIQPRFFSAQGYWYVAGHFPCGWSARPPGGKLVIY